MLSSEDQHALLNWYDQHQRDLPWRRTRNPWHILLSEILLQQTQVSRGLVYWTRMVEAFPTVASMAKAPVDAVLKAWEVLAITAERATSCVESTGDASLAGRRLRWRSAFNVR